MLKYFIDDELVTESEFFEKLLEAINDKVSSVYDDLLNEDNDDIHIGSITLSPAFVLSKCDPIAYTLGLNDYVDAMYRDVEYEFNRPHFESFSGYDFETRDVEDEDE